MLNKNIIEKIEKNYRKILLLILIIGFLLRFYAVFIGLGSNHYSKIDELEAYIWGQQLRYYGHPRFFTYIPGPYLSLIPFLLIKLFKTVKSIYYFWVLLGTFSIYLIFWLSKKLFEYCHLKNNFPEDLAIENNIKPNKININFVQYPYFLSLLIALVFAVFPWSVKYTVSYWNPHFIIIFSTLLLGYLFDILTKYKTKNIFGLIISISVMPFFHMIIIYAIPVVLLMIFLRKRLKEINYLYLSFGIFISILIWIPFFIFDKNSGFFILSSYIRHGSGLLRFRAETLKIIINPFLIITLDISRFTGHYFFEYKYYLDRAYGFFVIGLIPVLASILLALYSFYIAFRCFSIKNFIQNKNIKQKILNPINYILLFMLGTLFFHLLSLQIHEDRYTVIFFAVPYIILGYGIYHTILSFKLEKTNFNKIISILIIICLIAALYINISHFYQERYPNINNKVRLIPSLIYYEKIKTFVLKDYFEFHNILENPLKYLNFVNLNINNSLQEYHSLFDYPFIKNLLLKNNQIYNQESIIKLLSNPDIRYIFLLDNIFIEKDKSRQKQIITCIKRFININTNLVADEKDIEKLKKNNI
ncbi:MAG: hypothetical protein ACK4YF_09485, partial [Exilispira sp.]